MKYLTRSLLAVVCLLLVPVVASAQATLSGRVADSSGGVLPGVTVEARSPNLIGEGVRVTVSDGTGIYTIPALPPGTYSVTFTLPGFSTVVREGVELAGAATFTINASLSVGALEETITVTGETPVVDVQSSRRGTVIDDDVIKALPATRGYNAIIAMVPGMNTGQQVDLMPTMRIFYSHGGRGNEGRVQVDGLNVGAAFNGGGVSGYVMDTANAEEMAFTIMGGLGEAETGGTLLNIVPKTGGNTYSGSAFLSTAGEWSQGSNLDDDLRSFGIQDPSGIIQNWDTSVAVGGPFVQDRLWFFGTYRNFGMHQKVPGGFANAAAFDQNRWDYEQDPNIKIRGANATSIAAMRLTAQVHPLHKVGVYFDYQFKCDGSAMTTDASNCRPAGSDWVANGNALNAPEAASGVAGLGNTGAAGYQDAHQKVAQFNYTSPLTNQLLIEAGYSSYFSRWGWMAPPGNALDYTLVNIQNTGQNYRGLDWNFDGINWNRNWRASMSYVTGSHNMKFGYQGGLDIMDQFNNYNNTRLGYRFGNADTYTPNRLTMRLARWNTKARTKHTGLYAQDQWTRDRLSLQGAIRFERGWSYFPDEQGWPYGPDLFLPAAVTFPATVGVDAFNDIFFRGGLAYDVFGDGKTSLKVNWGQYGQAINNQDLYSAGNPSANFGQTTNRIWNDNDGDYVPDCDLMNPAAQGVPNSGPGTADYCSGWDNGNFGSPTASVPVNPDLTHGWGVRPADYQFGVAVQQEVLPRVSVEVAYNRRGFKNFNVQDNLSLSPADFDTFTVTAPVDPRLGEYSGRSITAVALKPGAFGRPADNYVTSTDDYGNVSNYWQGVDVNVQARMSNGLIVQGGTSTGGGVRDNCDIWAALPEVQNSGGFVPVAQQVSACRIEEPWLTQFRGLVSYVVPVIDVQLSANIKLLPGVGGQGSNDSGSNGASLAANYPFPRADVEAALGRPLAGFAPTYTVNLLNSGELYGDRVNQIDVRLAKILRFRGTETQLGFDFYNIFNANPVLTYNQTFGPAWLTPQTILLPRFVRFQITTDF